jgi:uncharacterized membrane protein
VSSAEYGTPIFNRQSGYIRYININRPVVLAKAYQICVHLERRVGQFVPAGVPLMRVSKPERVPADRALHLVAAFDIGPACTKQQDVEFGIIQIVDIALRAISPAVNDPKHCHQLRGSAQSDHDPLDKPYTATVSLLRAAARIAAVRAVDSLRRLARYGV